jgi:hypothetical protein
MGTGAEVGGYGRGKVRGKTAGRSGLWDQRGVGGVGRREGRRYAGPCVKRGEVLIVDGRQCEGSEGAFVRVSGSSSGGEVSEFIASDTNVGLDLLNGSMKSQGGTVGKEGADVEEKRKKGTQKRGLRDRLNPTLVPAIRIPGPREQTYTTGTRS